MTDQRILNAEQLSFFALAQDFGNPKPLKRIFSLMRACGVKTVVLEVLRPSATCIEDLALMNKQLKCPCERKRTKISFFSKSLKNQQEIKGARNSDYLGYAIVNNDVRGENSVSFVAESVTKPPVGDNDFVHSQARYVARVLGREFTVTGSYFTEKDRFTSSCAHAALKISIENMRQRTGKTLSYHEINELLGMDYRNKSPADGLIPKEIEKVLKAVDLVPVPFNFERPAPQVKLHEAIYYAAESNWPVILVFPLREGVPSHAVTVVGHKFDPDAWLPEVHDNYFKLDDEISFRRSSAWTSGYKIQDDNYGPYYNLPSHYFADKKPVLIAVAPKSLGMYGDEAEPFAYDELLTILGDREELHLFPPSKWRDIALDHIIDGKIILRTLYITRGEYLAHLGKRDYFTERDLRAVVIRELPTSFWLVEMSIPELFTANKGKIGEMVVDPSAEYPHTVKAIWLSGTYYLVDSNQYLLIPGEEYYRLA